MARFISSAATFEKESFSKENEYIYICVYIYQCGGAKRSWMQWTIANDYKQFACFQVLYRSSKKIPLYSIEGQIGRYEITMLWIDTNTREIWFYLHLAIFCNHYDHFLQMFGYRNTNFKINSRDWSKAWYPPNGVMLMMGCIRIKFVSGAKVWKQ